MAKEPADEGRPPHVRDPSSRLSLAREFPEGVQRAAPAGGPSGCGHVGHSEHILFCVLLPGSISRTRNSYNKVSLVKTGKPLFFKKKRYDKSLQKAVMLLGGLCPWGSRPLSWPENSCLGPFSGPGPTPRDPGWPVSSSGLGLWEGVLCTCPQRDSQWGFRKHCEQPGVGSPAHRVQMGPASLLAMQAARGPQPAQESHQQGP